MSDKFADRYRIKSSRLPEWDYSYGDYFITVCVKNREHCFAKIVDGKMELNELGKIADEEIKYTAKIRKNVIIDEYIIMPDHIHVIISIEKNKINENNCGNSGRDALHASHELNASDELHASDELNASDNKGDGCKPSLQKNKNIFGVQKNNLASIVRGIKGSITSKIKKINNNFAWQSRYYECIICNEKELNIIREYIKNNPLKENNSDLFL